MSSDPIFRTTLATTDAELRLAQRLRYEVFVEELGGGGAMVDHAARLEQDAYDPFFDHLLLFDDATNAVVGAYRLLRCSQAQAAGQFYSEDEYNLDPLKKMKRNLLELGRSCLHPAYRGGAAMMHLWAALAEYVASHKIDLLFGVASFHGTDPNQFARPLSLLHHRHLAPEAIRVKARAEAFQTMNLIAPDHLDRRTALLEMPALIKAYLRLGGVVGEGAFIDESFNTTDVFLMMDTQNMNEKQARLYAKAGL